MRARRKGAATVGPIRQFALGGGGALIWNTVDEIFPGGVQILDLNHVLERLSDAAKAIHDRGDMAKALAKRWRGMVKFSRSSTSSNRKRRATRKPGTRRPTSRTTVREWTIRYAAQRASRSDPA
ncbi:MAG: hypothetical protein OXC26_24540 [Albidovulum sp.]|nr:hypothetical protein [Albidovulum sp.]